MAWFPEEADGARGAPSSPGLPRGTQHDLGTAPREAERAPRASPHGRIHESSGDHRHASLDELATALADAFLAAGAWTPAALTRAGAATIGDERALVGLAVGAALRALPRPPADAPRLLAAVLRGDGRLADAHAARDPGRRPVRVLVRTATPVRAAAGPPAPLHVDTLPELARALGVDVGHLLWLADARGWNAAAPADSPLHHYRSTWLPRPGRTPRLLEAPLHLLRTAQRSVLDDLLGAQPVHDAAHGFVPGRSALTAARQHVGREVVVTLDLVSCFASVTAPRVHGTFRRAGLAEPLAHVLTGLCTTTVPRSVLRAMPPGGDPDERAALRRALTLPHLPQGAPTSPALANLTLRRLDARLAGWAESCGASYTRYADDLAFSGDRDLARRVDAFVRGAARIVADEGHALNPRKTRVRRRGVRQTVTGVVVNDRPGTGRREHDALKALLHNCVRHGPDGQDRTGATDFRAHLRGRVAWVEQVHPERGARLRALYGRIDWGTPPAGGTG
ncbi:reverse transcriptase domain-containing protein [Frigoribacterium salinisoli]